MHVNDINFSEQTLLNYNIYWKNKCFVDVFVVCTMQLAVLSTHMPILHRTNVHECHVI